MTRKRALTILVLMSAVWLALFGARQLLRVTHGLRAEYFDSPSAGVLPVLTAVDSAISLTQVRRQWGSPLPPVFKVRWFGYLNVRRADAYVFALTSDDGSTLTIDGRPVIDNGGQHAASTRTGTIDLEPGAHAVLIEYTQLGGTASLEWTWARDGSRQEAVPSWVLSTARQPAWKIVVARMLDLLLASVFVTAVASAVWIIVTFGSIPVWDWCRAHPQAPVLVFFVALTIAETWPLATDPAHLSRNDNGDTLLNEWALAWVAHQAPRHPLRVFDGNAFYPERDTLAFSEAMPLQSAMAAPILWAGGSPVLAYNIVLLAGFALTGWAMSTVIANWTGDRLAGLTAGTLFAFNAHSLTRLPHLQAQHVEFLPLALMALDRLLRKPDVRNAMRLGGWFVLQALTSIYLLVLTATALAAGGLVRPESWAGRRAVRTGACVLLAAAVAAVLLLPFVLPYWRLYHDQGLTRSVEEAARFSAVWQDYASTPSWIHYRWWSHRWFSGSAFFPGALALVLAGVAIARGLAFRDRRARMCLAIGIAGVVLSFGTKVPGFATVYEHLPLLHAVRVVSRFGFLGILATAALAGFGAADVGRRMGRLSNAVGAVLLTVATIECFAGPLELTRFDGIPRIYRTIRDVPGAIVVEMPFYGGSAGFAQARYMLNSTAHWQPILNGYTGLHVRSYERNIEQLARFPDPSSIAALRAQRVTHVFVHTDDMPAEAVARLGTVRELRPIATEGPIVLFRLGPEESAGPPQ